MIPITQCLLAWIADGRRDLPWRRRRDPYAVWISEIMLQQTQAATVIPYFERWLARFPDVHALAAASLDDVLKAWEGLGYYARARNLYRAAQDIVQKHNGALPADRQALLALPGIGRYTTGAILSLAFGRAEPVLDGNVRRVLCRLYDIAEDPRQPAVERSLWDLATTLVNAAPAGQAGDLNEALMELGALICTPSVAACPTCPLQPHCLAYARDTVSQRPIRGQKAPTPHFDVVAGAIRDETGCYLIVRRPEHGLLGGLWGFPGGALTPDEAPLDGLARTIREQVGIEVLPGVALTRIKHAYTHFRITLHAFAGELLSGQAQPLRCTEVRWVTHEGLASYAFPVTDRKIVAAMESGILEESYHVSRH